MPLPFKRMSRLSSWRRLALHTWPAPRDSTVYSTLEVDMTEAEPFLDRLRRRSGVRVTPTHLVAKAMAMALQRYPESNAIIRRGWVYQRESIDIFFQVVADGGEDLGGTKLENVDRKSVLDIARELAERAQRIRAHRDADMERTKSLLDRVPNFLLGPVMRLTAAATHVFGLDLTRFGLKPDPFGTVMVSNVGTFRVDWAFAPLVPFARSPIVLLLGTVRPRPMVVDGQVVARPVLVIGVTLDHRLIDGAQAARLSEIVCDVIAHPAAHLPEEG